MVKSRRSSFVVVVRGRRTRTTCIAIIIITSEIKLPAKIGIHGQLAPSFCSLMILMMMITFYMADISSHAIFFVLVSNRTRIPCVHIYDAYSYRSVDMFSFFIRNRSERERRSCKTDVRARSYRISVDRSPLVGRLVVRSELAGAWLHFLFDCVQRIACAPSHHFMYVCLVVVVGKFCCAYNSTRTSILYLCLGEPTQSSLNPFFIF